MSDALKILYLLILARRCHSCAGDYPSRVANTTRTSLGIVDRLHSLLWEYLDRSSHLQRPDRKKQRRSPWAVVVCRRSIYFGRSGCNSLLVSKPATDVGRPDHNCCSPSGLCLVPGVSP